MAVKGHGCPRNTEHKFDTDLFNVNGINLSVATHTDKGQFSDCFCLKRCMVNNSNKV